MDYIYMTAPFIFGGFAWLIFYALGESLEIKECKHVTYPDDTVCLICEKDIALDEKAVP